MKDSALVQLDFPPQGEDRAIQQVEQLTASKLLADYPPGSPHTPRDAHPKSNGCVRAEFTVEADVPEALKVGLFAAPKTYGAWIRFSNGFPHSQADKKRDVRGAAIKVVGVPGEKVLEDEKDAVTQDFLLANHPTFFVKDVADYVELITAINAGKPISFFLGWNPLRWRLIELKNFVQALFKSVPSPTGIRYWSQVPYRCGNRPCKYSLVPRVIPQVPATPTTTDNYLRAALKAQLAAGDVVLDFMVQLQTSQRQMPVEDSRWLWSESRSPFIKVATIRIPAQDFDNAERDTFAENLSFTPWHTLPEHAPLGGINRCRRIVYQAISKIRHTANGVLRQEPTE